MPAFIHDRAEHILAKNPKMGKSTAFAVATQQSHALGKSPRGYGTSEGKATAKKKYPSKKSYVKGANPGKLRTPKLERREKNASVMDVLLFSKFASALRDKAAPHSKRPKDNGMVNEDRPDPTDQSYGDEQEEAKVSYSVSQYSGPLSEGRFKQESHIPPFRAPPVKTAGPPACGKEKKAYDPSPLGNVDLPGMRKMQTPAKQLQKSKGVADFKATQPDASKALNIKLPTIGSTI